MATLALCDLCGGKVKLQFVNLSITGTLQVYKGDPPPAPEGFKYQDEDERGKSFIKVWDGFGRVIAEMNLMPKPPKWRKMQVNYDLCEECAQKLQMLLEQLRSKYHMEKKEIKFLDKPRRNHFLSLMMEDRENWRGPQDDDEDDEDENELD